MQTAVGAAFTGVTALIAFIPAVGPMIAGVAAPILAAVTPVVGAELNRLLDLQDDEIGRATLAFSARDIVLLAARQPYAEEKGIQFKRASELISGDGASYKVYFAADLV